MILSKHIEVDDYYVTTSPVKHLNLYNMTTNIYPEVNL